MKPNRREFILFFAAPATAAPRIRIRPGLDGVPGRPWRKVHPEFHNSGHIFARATEYAAIAAGSGVAVFGFPPGASCYDQGYRVYRNALRHVPDALPPDRLMTANAALGAEVKVTRQFACASRPERYLGHVVDYPLAAPDSLEAALPRVPVHKIVAFEVS